MTRAIAALGIAWAMLLYVGMTGGIAHDHHNPEMDDWFKGLRSKAGAHCCNGSDYEGIADPDWQSKDGKYQVRLNGVWHDVPPDAVIDTPNKVGQAMVWPYEIEGQTFIRCFMPGALA